jgi:hypothetical protein
MMGGWGYLEPQPPKWPLVRASVAWRTGQSGAPATSPGRWVPTVGASDRWATGQFGGAPNSHYSLSGAPSGAALTSARAGAHCSLLLFLCRRSLALYSRYSAGTPDSSVLHRTVRWIIAEWLPEFSKVASLELGSLVHRTLSGGAPDSSVRQIRAAFSLTLLLYFERFLLSLYWFVVNLWHL